MTSLSIAQIEYAPVVLIAYNRVEHVNQTLEALSLNIDADNTKLYCYIDGPKNIHDAKSQTMIISVINVFIIDLICNDSHSLFIYNEISRQSSVIT